jgi:CMP-N,N'-diacetyllegionaminic acid synthase
MINSKRVLAVTLARGGSKRVPNKNIRNIAGKPLIKYTFEEIKKSKYIDHYIVSTDCEKTKQICKDNNVFFHNRPIDLATDFTTSADSLMDVVKNYPGFDIVVEVMATNPLKSFEDIDGVIEKLVKTNADSVVSVVRIWDNHPARVKYIENDRMINFYPEIPESRRQDLSPPAYVRNGSIYALKVKAFLKHRVRVCPDSRPFIMPEERTINIDEMKDFYLAEILINERV